MARKRTAQQQALKRAWLRPEKPLHMAKDSWRGAGSWPFVWKFWTNGRQLNIGLGKPWKRMGGKGMPVSQFTFGVARRPFSIILWWGLKRVFWIGDREWKKVLSKSG